MNTPHACAAACFLLALAPAGCKVDADFSDVAPTPVVLPAEEYRPEIETIDRLVFAPGDFTKDRRADLGAGLESLATRIQAASSARFITLESLELRAEATRARTEAPGGVLGRDWIRLRSNLFDDRAWFARSAADLAGGP